MGFSALLHKQRGGKRKDTRLSSLGIRCQARMRVLSVLFYPMDVFCQSGYSLQLTFEGLKASAQRRAAGPPR
jgi:hypothetical protein